MAVRMRVSRVRIHHHTIRNYVNHSPAIGAQIKAMAEDLAQQAREEYLRANEGHSVHEPPYEDQFFVESERDNVHKVGNRSLVARMVEFGTHAAGETATLGYAPFRKGKDAVIARWQVKGVIL